MQDKIVLFRERISFFLEIMIPDRELSQTSENSFCGVTTEGSALFTQKVISEHLRELGYPERSIQSMEKCGSLIGMKVIKHCPGCGDTHLIDLKHFCSLRTCLTCSERRKIRITKRYLPFFQHFPITRGSPKSLFFLTISPKNYEEFALGLKHIKASWKKFLRTKYVKERIEGGLWVIEAKNKNNSGEEKGWNVHIHALFYGRRLDNSIRGYCKKCHQNHIKFDKATGKYFCANSKCRSLEVEHNQDSKIVSLFQECSDCPVHVDIQEIYSNPKGALKYILKYVSANKGEFASSRDFAVFIKYTRKQKLINLFGTFSKFKPKKPIYHCLNCGSPLEFMFDLQIMFYLEKRKEQPPPNLPIQYQIREICTIS